MRVEWAGLSPELLLRLDRDVAEPLRSQLERELREAIRSGRLSADERLPSSRVLARELGVSRGLVLDCYTQLEAEGYLTARGGSGTRVAAGAHMPSPAPAVPRPAPDPAPRIDVDFRPGLPDLGSFPRSDWVRALRDAARDAPDDAFGYGDGQGSPVLRTVLASYLRRVRGAAADPGHVVVCSGFQQGLNLALRAVAAEGVERVAVEDPGDGEHAVIARRLGLEPVPVPVDAAGIDVEALAASGARAVVLTPAHQSPTGCVLAPERRQALVAWADAADAFVVEDDYDAEFRYDREPVGSLQGLAPDRVVSIGTVSKSLAPGLRLGWLVAPPRLAARIVAEKHLDDRGSPALDQLALATLIESGRYDRHLRRMRATYGRRRATLVDALGRHAPHVGLEGLAAGFHAVARLPASLDEEAVVAAALGRSVGLYPMSRYRWPGHSGPPSLVLGFGNLTESAIERGIARVADLFAVHRT
ncbi:MAG TPA: PLP-dependent aminotransferase family protein [Acidimicrobiales bacterium]|nr:PLP-dependent aminotransferase family protein [Acidimicrobiales bacterium]